jgi:hypothetical protein
MTFIQRLGISIAIAAAFPLFVVNYSLPSAYETHLLFTCTFVWLLMMPLSLYSSPTVPVGHDAHVNPVLAFLKDASLRARVGRYIVLVSMAIFMAFLLFASYAFAEKYEFVVLGPVIAFGSHRHIPLSHSDVPLLQKAEPSQSSGMCELWEYGSTALASKKHISPVTADGGS